MADISPTMVRESDGAIDLASAPEFTLGGIMFHPALREVVTGEHREIVEPRMMQVLVALCDGRGRVISRDRLIERAWGGRIVSEDAINNCIAKLRRLGQAHDAFTIETVSRVGYRLVERTAPAGRTLHRWPPRALTAVLVLFIAVIGAFIGWRIFEARQAAPILVAVHPFEASPNDPTTAAVARRVHDQIITALSAQQLDVVPELRSGRAAVQFKGVVEAVGGVAQVRLTALDGKTGTVLWQDAFEGPADLDGSLALQVTARAVTVAATATEMLEASKGRIPAAVLRDYVQAREGYRQLRNPVAQVAAMRRIAERAPQVALIHAVVAQTLVNGASDQPPQVRAAWLREAMAESKKAIRLDPEVGLAYSAQSSAFGPAAFAERQAALEEGLRRAPLDGAVQAFHGLFLAETGRPREGLAFMRRSQAIDPFAPPRRFTNVAYFAGVGAVEEGRLLLAENRRIWPQNRWLLSGGMEYAVLAAGPEEGRELLHELARGFPDFAPSVGIWASFFDAIECRCRIDKTATALRAAAFKKQIPPGLGFAALTRLGAIDTALEVAELAEASGHARDNRLLFAVQTAAARHDRRFIDLTGKLGLLDYWRASGRWPEFCADPALPYDCKAEAARVARGA